jgi:hypothetical protein
LWRKRRRAISTGNPSWIASCWQNTEGQLIWTIEWWEFDDYYCDIRAWH